MNEFEQQYLPEAYRPLSPWAYFGLSILYSVPVIGWIFLIAHALASRNINKRNYARSFFCIYILAAIVILGMIGTVLGGGVMMVKNVYQRTQDQADAEQALSLTAQLMTDEFANALEVKDSTGSSGTGELVTPLLRSGNSHLWLRFSAADWSGTGIEKWYGDYTYNDADNKIPLLTQAAIPDEYYTAFDGYTYSEETACFTVKNLAVYRKKDTSGTSRKAVVRPINLTVRAVNLDQK